MLCSCAMGPLRMKKAAITRMQPIVKQMANFCGASTMTGRKTVKARKRKRAPVAMVTMK